MAIRTEVQRRHKIWCFAFALVCLALGLWGLYDWQVTVPNQWAAYERSQELQEQREEIEQVAERRDLTDEEAEAYETLQDELNALGSIEKPGEYDAAVQLWLYVIGCGVLGTPIFIYEYFRVARQVYRLDDDGTLHLPNGQAWSTDEIADIDMSRWMKKSIAYVEHVDGTRVKLDDYKFKNTHLIVGALASKFYPDQWTAEARMVKTQTDEQGEVGQTEDGAAASSPGDAADSAPAADGATEERAG